MFDQHFPVSISLILRQDADRPECKDFLFCSVFIRQFSLRVHDIPDHLAVQFRHEIKLRHKILMSSHDMNKIMFHTPRRIYIIKCLSCNIFYDFIVCLYFISDFKHFYSPLFASLFVSVS